MGDNIIMPLKRVWNVFFNPDKTFRSMSGKISWKDLWLPVLLLILVSMLTIQLTHPVQMKESRQIINRMDNVTEQQREAMIQRLSTEKAPVQNLILGGITPVVSALFVAVFYLFAGNFFGGGYAQYLTMAAVSLHISMVDVLASIIKVPLMLYQETMMIHTSLAIFFDDLNLSSIWYRIAMQADIFRIWKWILWIIAFKVIYHYSGKKACVLTGIIWLLGALITIIIQGFSPLA